MFAADKRDFAKGTDKGTEMRFGVFYELQLPRPWNTGDERNLFHQALDQVQLADRLGFDYAWEVEHHFLEEYSHSSAPEVFLAAAAALTKSIRLGHGIRQVIPNYNHPARTAEAGTYVCMEGPQFSSHAESMTYKGLGYSVIGMTKMPEAKLAREAEICYATVAMVTDFDCWHPDHDAVTVQDIIRVLTTNADKAKGLVARLAREFPREHEPCPIGSDRVLDTALITAPEARDPALLKKLDAVAGRILRA